MAPRPISRLLAASLCCAAGVGACGSGAPADVPTPTISASAVPAARVSGARLLDWPLFGLNPSRTGASERSTGIGAPTLGSLRRVTVSLPGTVDSSPVYLHGVAAAGAARNLAVMTTSYGRTVALDADSGRILWTFTPAGYGAWAGSSRITTAGPAADPDRAHVYTASPDGLIHRLSLSSGAEQRGGGWPARVTLDPAHEKLAASLNLYGRWVIAATGGYLGDAPPYQGHVVLIDRVSGHIGAVFNTLCAGRRALMPTRSCPASGSAVLSRAGAVVEPGGRRLLISTGNGAWNGTSNFGDSVIELELPTLRLRQAYTPSDQAQLQASDTDLGSSAPALLGPGRAAVAGKDGVLRLLGLDRLDGSPPGSGRQRLGGELQRLSVPGGGELFTAPAVWRAGASTTMFVADGQGTAAYVLRAGRLLRAWLSPHPGTSPVLAGGLLYVYDPSGGGIYVYSPGSPRALAHLPGSPGHWNSPVVADGHIIEPEGNANDHSQSGSVDILSAP